MATPYKTATFQSPEFFVSKLPYSIPLFWLRTRFCYFKAASSPVVLASFDVTSAIKLVGRTRPGPLAINGKSKMAEWGQVSNFSQTKWQPHLVSTVILKCSVGMYVTYTSQMFPDPHRKKQVFVEQYLWVFLAELGLFALLCQAFSLIAPASKPPPLTRLAGIGLGMRLVSSLIFIALLPLLSGQQIIFSSEMVVGRWQYESRVLQMHTHHRSNLTFCPTYRKGKSTVWSCYNSATTANSSEWTNRGHLMFYYDDFCINFTYVYFSTSILR